MEGSLIHSLTHSKTGIRNLKLVVFSGRGGKDASVNFIHSEEHGLLIASLSVLILVLVPVFERNS